MGVIYTTVFVLGGIGILAAAVLYFVAKKFYVYENPKISEIEELLPGANCGGCGFSGCHAFAKACAEAKTLEGFNCTGAGKGIMQKISRIVGLEAESVTPKVAVVKCDGSCANREHRNVYDGVTSCVIENFVYQGESDCIYGCLGCGDCVGSCIFDAIHMDKNSGLPVVDYDKCVGCGKCVKTCPRNIIELVSHRKDTPIVYVACMNHDKGAVAMKECKVSCIGCGKCSRSCPSQAITVTDFVAHIDPDKCIGCGECVDQCPRSSIEHIGNLKLELRPVKAETEPLDKKA